MLSMSVCLLNLPTTSRRPCMCITLRSTTSIWAFLRQFHANKVELLPAVYVSGEVPSHSRYEIFPSLRT